MILTFFAEGLPKGQPRPRAFAFKGRARVYDPGTAEAWKSAVASAARPHRPQAPLEAALTVDLAFRFPRAKSHFRASGQLTTTAPRYHTAKPDTDNAAKAVLDALTEIGFWRDDAQVCRLTIQKHYAAPHETTGCLVTIGDLT